MDLRKYRIYILAVLTSIIIAGCGYREGVLEKDQKSYLSFTGETENAVVFIDDYEPFKLTKSGYYYIDENTGKENRPKKLEHYQISPGKHRIVIKRNETVILEREILIGNGIVREVQVP